MLVELTRADADDEDYAFAAEQVAQGADEAAVVRRLVRRGLNVSAAGVVALQTAEARAGQKSGTARALGVGLMALGALLIVLGALGATSQGPGHPANWGTVVIGFFLYRPSRPAGLKPQPLGGGYFGRYVGRGMLAGAGVGFVAAVGSAAATGTAANVVTAALVGPLVGLALGFPVGLAYALVRKLVG